MVDGGSNVFLLVRCNILYLGYWVVAWYTSEVRLLLWDYHTLYQQFGYGNSVAVALFIWLYHCLIDLNNNSFVSCSFVRIIFVAAHLFITYCFGFLINLLISALVDLFSSSLFVLYSCSFGMLALLLLKLSKGLMVLFFLHTSAVYRQLSINTIQLVVSCWGHSTYYKIFSSNPCFVAQFVSLLLLSAYIYLISVIELLNSLQFFNCGTFFHSGWWCHENILWYGKSQQHDSWFLM